MSRVMSTVSFLVASSRRRELKLQPLHAGEIERVVASSRRRELKPRSGSTSGVTPWVASSRRRELKLITRSLWTKRKRSPPHGGVS